MFGNVTALDGLRVTGKYRTKHDAHMLQACGLGSSHIDHRCSLRTDLCKISQRTDADVKAKVDLPQLS